MSAIVTGQKTEEMSGTGASMFVGGWGQMKNFITHIFSYSVTNTFQ